MVPPEDCKMSDINVFDCDDLWEVLVPRNEPENIDGAIEFSAEIYSFHSNYLQQ